MLQRDRKLPGAPHSSQGSPVGRLVAEAKA